VPWLNLFQSKTGVPVLPISGKKTIPPPHLQMNYKVVDDAGADLAMSRDLSQLKAQLGQAAQLTFAQSGAGRRQQY